MTQTTIGWRPRFVRVRIVDVHSDAAIRHVDVVRLVAALIGDLILLPAILVSPLGKFFKPRSRSFRKAADVPFANQSSATDEEREPCGRGERSLLNRNRSRSSRSEEHPCL